jgi:hypothetical protein
MIASVVSIIATVIFSIMIVFEFLLVIGVPLGYLAWGGQYKELPPKLRIMSAVAIGIFIYAIIMVLEVGGIIDLINIPLLAYISVWVLAVYFTLGILMNGVSRSKWEQRIMTPIAALSAVCCYVIVIFI